MNKEVIPLSATTHFPTKLNDSNFPVWKKQIETTLFGYNLLCYLTGELSQPAQFTSDKILNPDYQLWSRQDQFILSALLGSCIETIQPSISTALTSKEAWEKLQKLYANKSRSHVLALKAKLMQNPRGNRSISEYMQDVRATADSLALVDCPVSDEDLFLTVITQLGPEFSNITSSLRARDSAISFDDLVDRLRDMEIQIQKDATPVAVPLGDTTTPAIPTANYTSKNTKNWRPQHSQPSTWRPTSHTNRTWKPHANTYHRNPSYTFHRPSSNTSRTSSSYCYYCNRPNHTTKDCRQLAKFLTDFGIQPQANVTSTGPISPQPWLFDSGASHHVTTDLSNLSNYSDYGGPDVVTLGDGSGYTHGGAASSRRESK